MSTPLFHRTGAEDFPGQLKIMVSGPPKSGKTTLLGTVPNIVIADTEPHANNLASVAHKNLPYVSVAASEELQRLRFVLADNGLRAQAAEQLGMPAIEAVAIDTLDTLQGILKRERLRETRKSEFLRDDWGWLKEQLTAILQAYLALPLHVIFVVHTKTKEIGRGDDSRTIIAPGLEGAISESIAGMVGYSLLAFRRQAVRSDGSGYTEYLLRAEGDENYDFLGNRSAGRLPDVIAPDFPTILAAALAGRPTATPEPVAVQIQTTAQNQPAQNQPGTAASQPAGSPTAAGSEKAAPEQATQPQPGAASKPDGNQPVNAAALTHVRKVYDALGLEFPEQTITELNLEQARTLVRMWKAAQADEAAGRANAVATMTDYLAAMAWLSPADQTRSEAAVDALASGGQHASPPAQAPAEQSPAAEQPTDGQGPTARIDGTIEQIMAYVSADGEPDAHRAQAAYDLEQASSRPRSSLLSALLSKGARAPQPAADAEPAEPAVGSAAPEDQAAPQDPAPGAQAPGPDSPPSDAEALARVTETLGASPLPDTQGPQACVECGNPVDDLDIARLSEGRFRRWLCVADYIAETKKPRTPISA